MGTQGMVSLVRDGHVLIKAICGCNGYNAEALARAIIESPMRDVATIYNMARENDFGCPDCLIVLDQDHTLFGPWPEPPDRYFDTFDDPQFNPRWEQGTIGHLFIVPI